jgi:hypothetical protein
MPLSKESAEALNADFICHAQSRFPLWLQHIRVLPDEDANENFVELVVPNPPGIVHENPIGISTWGEEVTVSFDAQHRHFPWPNAYDGSDNRDRVMDHVQALMNEDIVIVSVWNEGRRKIISDVRPANLGKYPRLETSDHELHVRSWRGTYDDTFAVDWKSYLES